MTSARTKLELNKEFKDIKYILTSSMRAKLLLALYEIPKNLDELRHELKKPSATILHGLKELETINLVRRANRSYELTSNGYLLTTNMIKLIENWFALSKSEKFWDTHDISGIPEEIIKNIYLLKDAEYVSSTTSDLSIAFNRYISLISQATKLSIILPIYSENHFRHIIDLLDSGQLKKVELIVTEEIYESIHKNKQLRKELLKNKKVKTAITDKDLKIFLTYSENFMSLTLFFKDGHYDDSQILIGNDQNALKWAFHLIKYFRR